MYERVRATAVGALLGLTSYVAWISGSLTRLHDPANWNISGPMKWFVLVGALIGLFGGLALVESWLEREKGEILENNIFNGLFVIAIAEFLAITFISLNS